MCITYFSLAHSARRDGVPDVLVGGLLGLHDGQGRPGATPFVPLRFVLGGILRLGGHVLPRISLSNSGACMGGRCFVFRFGWNFGVFESEDVSLFVRVSRGCHWSVYQRYSKHHSYSKSVDSNKDIYGHSRALWARGRNSQKDAPESRGK